MKVSSVEDGEGDQMSLDAVIANPADPKKRCDIRFVVDTGAGMTAITAEMAKSLGLGASLIRETLGLCGTDSVELIAVMAKYNPFAEKAGMKRILEQRPPKEAVSIASVLEGLGFDTQLLGSRIYVVSKLQLLGSRIYVVSKLQALAEKDVLRIREAFAKYRHPRFMKSFSHLPFGTKDAYVKEIMGADLDELANLVRICGFLMQTKTYLFWKKED